MDLEIDDIINEIDNYEKNKFNIAYEYKYTEYIKYSIKENSHDIEKVRNYLKQYYLYCTEHIENYNKNKCYEKFVQLVGRCINITQIIEFLEDKTNWKTPHANELKYLIENNYFESKSINDNLLYVLKKID